MKFSKYLLVACSLFLFNCGGDEKKDDRKEVKIQANKPAETKTDANMVNLVITGNDLMQFDKTELRAKAGQKVKITLRHTGKLDKQVMGHNVIILMNDVNPEDFAAAAATARENNYIPEGATGIIAKTDMIGGGQTTTVEFTAPTEPGEYEFLCSFPGHFQMMRGKFIVE